MTRRRPRATRERALIGLAGWLFADLMLVIAIVAMGSQPDPLAARPAPAPSTHRPSPSPSPTTPSPSATPQGPLALEQTPQIIVVHAPAGDTAALTAQLTKALVPYRGRRAGIVETFGWGSDSSSDTAYATEVNALLDKIAPSMFPPGTPEENYIDLGSQSGGAKIKIYLFAARS